MWEGEAWEGLHATRLLQTADGRDAIPLKEERRNERRKREDSDSLLAGGVVLQ